MSSLHSLHNTRVFDKVEQIKLYSTRKSVVRIGKEFREKYLHRPGLKRPDEKMLYFIGRNTPSFESDQKKTQAYRAT